ncbi:MAG: cytochrome c biogenesis protein DipZ, partial [Gammaproteobacteria bacterium]|nr:cytochrome c biogenesis protein DipZ [Gammaproteobacteria bacterium]
MAFIEGLGLIFSPCILPVLPLILATSITGSRRQPFLIILGFIISFTLFALLSRHIIDILGIPQEGIHSTAYILLLVFGLILLVPFLENLFAKITQPFSNRAEQLTHHKNKDTVLGGLLIGILVGIIWIPCAGPILAAALIQIITAQTNLESIIVLTAFSIGSGIPLLLIALFGQQMIERLKFFARHVVFIRRIMGIIIIAFALFGLTGFNFAAWLVTPAQAEQAQTQEQNPYLAAPEIDGITKWFNSAPLTNKKLRGKVVIVDFWTYSCVNCIRAMPFLESMYKKYKSQGLVVVGIHSPEFPFERDPKNVADAIKRFKITFPVGQDNNYVTWKNFDNKYWPADYIIDREGKLRFSHFGEGNDAQIEAEIRALLKIPGTFSPTAESNVGKLKQTPETYLGYTRTKNFASRESITNDKSINYNFAGELERDHWALQGKWIVSSDHITSDQANAKLMLYFTAQKVYLVLGSATNKPITLSIKLNGTPMNTVIVQKHKLYELLNQSQRQNGILEINASAPGLEAYAFTFG